MLSRAFWKCFCMRFFQAALCWRLIFCWQSKQYILLLNNCALFFTIIHHFFWCDGFIASRAARWLYVFRRGSLMQSALSNLSSWLVCAMQLDFRQKFARFCRNYLRHVATCLANKTGFKGLISLLIRLYKWSTLIILSKIFHIFAFLGTFDNGRATHQNHIKERKRFHF